MDSPQLNACIVSRGRVAGCVCGLSALVCFTSRRAYNQGLLRIIQDGSGYLNIIPDEAIGGKHPNMLEIDTQRMNVPFVLLSETATKFSFGILCTKSLCIPAESLMKPTRFEMRIIAVNVDVVF